MTDINRITCPSCGSTPAQKKDNEDYVCEYCGTKYNIKKTVDLNYSRVGSEMTIKRLKEEIIQIHNQFDSSFQEYNRLKEVVDNPSFSVKNRKYWWVVSLLGFTLFIVSIFADAPLLAVLSVLLFIGGFAFLIHGLKETALLKNASIRFLELRTIVLPAHAQLAKKQEQIKTLLDDLG